MNFYSKSLNFMKNNEFTMKIDGGIFGGIENLLFILY